MNSTGNANYPQATRARPPTIADRLKELDAEIDRVFASANVGKQLANSLAGAEPEGLDDQTDGASLALIDNLMTKIARLRRANSLLESYHSRIAQTLGQN